MTNEEAIKDLTALLEYDDYGSLHYEAIEVAVKALQTEPCEDYISRQAAMDAMDKLEQEDIETYGCSIPEGFDGERAKEALRLLPSVQPELPECGDAISRKRILGMYESQGSGLDDDAYIVIKWVEDAPSVRPKAEWIPLKEQLPRPGQDILVSTDRGYVTQECSSRRAEGDSFVQHFIFAGDVNAWMPLPEPYKESEEL